MNKFINYIKCYIKFIVFILFIIFWILLYIKGYITLSRIYVFVFILIVIFLYQKCINWIDAQSFKLNDNLVYILLHIDNIKLLGFNIINFIYVLLYNLKFNLRLKLLADILTYIYEYMLVFPYYFIMHKYYTVLKIWKETPYKNLILNRFYGVILSVLIFSPLIWWVWEIFNKNWIYVYLLLVLIIYINEHLKYIYKYKYLNILKYIRILNICVEPSFIFICRNKVSIFAILIRKGIVEINNYYNKLDKFAFNINEVYLVIMDISLKFGNIQKSIDLDSNLDTIISCLQTNREVYSFNDKIYFAKLVVMRKTIVNENKYLFNYIFSNYESCIKRFNETLSVIIYARLNYKQFQLDLNKMNQLENFFVNIIKLIFFYILDLSINLYSLEEIKAMFIVSSETAIHSVLELNTSWLFNEENIQKLNNIINQKDIKTYKFFYEQMYLYSNIINLYKHKNYGINCDNFKYMYKYIDILLSNLSILKIKNNLEDPWILSELFSKLEYISINNILSSQLYSIFKREDITEDMLEIELNKYKEEIFKEWETSIKDVKLNKKVFYKRNMLRLENFNNKVLNEVNKYK